MLETQRIPIILFPHLAKGQGEVSFKDCVDPDQALSRALT